MNRPEKVKPETLEQIKRVMHEHHYTGNPYARNLIRSRTRSITFLINTIDNRFMLDTIEGAEERLNAAGYMLNIINIGKSLDKLSGFMEFLRERRSSMFMDGLILAGSYLYEKDYCSTIRHLVDCPFVVIDKGPLQGITSVYVQEERPLRDASFLMKRRGAHRCAILSGELDYSFSRRRCDLLLQALREQGIAVRPEEIFSLPMESAEASYRAMESMVDDPPDAVYASNEILSMGTLRCLHDYGKTAPGDVTVVSGEDSYLCTMTTPTLSAVRYPNTELGRTAAQKLLNRLDQRDAPEECIELDASFIPRES